MNPNVRMEMTESYDTKFFGKPTEELFRKTQRSVFSIQYVTLRDIQPNEEIFMDYGIHFHQALIQYQQQQNQQQQQQQQNHSSGPSTKIVPPFRHEIDVPDHFFPQHWLDQEQLVMDYPDWDIQQLQPSEISSARLTTGQKVGGMIDRIGLPIGFADTMQQWAVDYGLVEILHDYILGSKILPVDGEERLMINGAVWWMKRFEKEWESDMHYMTADDDLSHHQFMTALHEAGYGDVLMALGQKYGHQSLTCYYPSLIAISHCTEAYMHTDSEHFGNYNLIFPIVQANTSTAELVLGNDNHDYYIPYRYEREHAVVLGKLGLHGSAPCDYRDTKQMRIVISIYMADFMDEQLLDDVVEDWQNPPYPNDDVRRHIFMTNQHWHATNRNKTLITPQ
jgi:hypothetical protein